MITWCRFKIQIKDVMFKSVLSSGQVYFMLSYKYMILLSFDYGKCILNIPNIEILLDNIQTDKLRFCLYDILTHITLGSKRWNWSENWGENYLGRKLKDAPVEILKG